MPAYRADGKKCGAKKIYKSFIIGCGRIAGYSEDGSVNDFTHGYAYRGNPDIQIVGCMDIDNKKSNAFTETFNCVAFNDYQNGVADTETTIVSVCTPDNTHFKIVKSLITMDSKVQVIFLEKPACSTLNEMEELISLSAEKKIDIVVNHTRRFDNRYLKIKNNIADSIYGDLVNGLVTYYSGWQHNGVHIIDTLSFIFNDTIIIDSVTNSLNSPYHNDPTLEVKLIFSESPGMIYLTSFDEKYYQLFEFDLRFEKSRLRIEDFGSRILLENKKINNIGENVLVMNNFQFEKQESTAIQNAISIIVQRLKENKPELLDGYRLEDVTNTMKTIWEGAARYAG